MELELKLLEEFINNEESNKIISRFEYNLNLETTSNKDKQIKLNKNASFFNSIKDYSKLISKFNLKENYKIHLSGDYILRLPDDNIPQDFLKQIQKYSDIFDFTNTELFDFDNPAIIQDTNMQYGDFLYLDENIFEFEPRLPIISKTKNIYIRNPLIKIKDSKPKLIEFYGIRESLKDKLITPDELFL